MLPAEIRHAIEKYNRIFGSKGAWALAKYHKPEFYRFEDATPDMHQRLADLGSIPEGCFQRFYPDGSSELVLRIAAFQYE